MGEMLLGIFMGFIVVFLLVMIGISGIVLCFSMIWGSIGSLTSKDPDYCMSALGIMVSCILMLLGIAIGHGVIGGCK